ncbi:hypothetical protein PXK58_02000 [Phaeobacter gallaeciensis]|uniref:hypothetical protein n=1 Tax=Phaeobacter gallaeciensis TaxID=60890 RepID=UPI0023803C42|nr:hypothetical protein [Phaeobacter gallaeciensis]MDE4272737.1 hypothetical protein [Phaeobacter gallaeciensis]MDE4298310.1 hypothetical protein [Phaeobacter gallaeciensis]MDE5183498.1 hypothetical protein [Phaeobacter gallaeciensis]
MFELYPNFTSALDPLRAYVQDQRDGLLEAAELLGGSAGLRLALTATDCLAQRHPPTARTLKACAELLELLKLEHVHDPSRIESERFALLDPAWPVVEEICLLADGFCDVLDAYMDESEPHRVQSSQVAA